MSLRRLFVLIWLLLLLTMLPFLPPARGDEPCCYDQIFVGDLLRDVGYDIFEVFYAEEEMLPINYPVMLFVMKELAQDGSGVLDGTALRVGDAQSCEEMPYVSRSLPEVEGGVFFKCRRKILLKNRKKRAISVTYSLYRTTDDERYAVYADAYRL